MAEKKTTAKSPTKQDIQKELDETKTALKDAMDLIAQMKEQMAQQPQVTVVNATERRPNAKLKCINLYHGHLNVSTRPDGRGRVYEFKEYGQVQYIKYDDMLDIISSYPNTIASGLLYIVDKDFCDEQGVYEDMDKIYTKEMLDKLVYLREDMDVELLKGMSKPMLENVIMEIARLYNANEEMEPNKLAEIKKDLGYDIIKIAKDIKIDSPASEDE